MLALLDEILAHISQASEVDRPKSLGILYDIGCTLEKSIMKVISLVSLHFICFMLTPSLMNQNQLFKSECENGQLKFGTSVFHSYAHRWGCQLNYNPRLNKGWGLSDGEGLERDWSFLSPLVMPNRYSTRQHRLNTLHLRSMHRNRILRANAGQAVVHLVSNPKTSS